MIPVCSYLSADLSTVCLPAHCLSICWSTCFLSVCCLSAWVAALLSILSEESRGSLAYCCRVWQRSLVCTTQHLLLYTLLLSQHKGSHPPPCRPAYTDQIQRSILPSPTNTSKHPTLLPCLRTYVVLAVDLSVIKPH